MLGRLPFFAARGDETRFARLLGRGPRFFSYVGVTAVALWAGTLLGTSDGPRVASAVAVALNEEPRETESLSGPAALEFCRLLLHHAEHQLADVRDLMAVFHKLERIDGQLQALNIMDLKVRRQPLSIYMRWREPHAGRQILWREGQDDEQVLVRAGGWRARVVPVLKVDPNGQRAREYSRRPVTQIGIWNMNARMLRYLDIADGHPEVVVRMEQDVRLAERPCFKFSFVHPHRVAEHDYQRIQIYVDYDLQIPIACELYGFAEDAQSPEPLVESYLFTEVALDVGLTDEDFSPVNPRYAFRSE